MNANIYTITPELAEKWLSRNMINRKLSQGRVAVLAGAITRGEWRLNGDTIRFGYDGELLDGQHRLAAIVKAGVPIESLVVTGLESEVRKTIDQGKSRNLADVLAMRGEMNASNLASTVRGTFHWEQSRFRIMSGPQAAMTVSQGLDVLDRNPSLRESTRLGVRMARVATPNSIWGPLVDIFTHVNPDTAEYYVDGYITGANLDPNEPVLLLRERLIADRKQTHSKMPARTKMALAIKAWNFTYDGAEANPQNMRWRASGPAREAFPTIRGTEQLT